MKQKTSHALFVKRLAGNLLNEKERAPDDRPSIGIILCAEKDNLEVEFALKTKGNPIGVAEYQLQPKLPAGPCGLTEAAYSRRCSAVAGFSEPGG